MNKASKLSGVKWRKISAPQVWRPTDGEELIGYYAGRTKKDGKFGQYEVVLVLVPYKGAYTISGTQLLQLCDSGMLVRGDAIRIKFLGRKPLSDEREVKLFELSVGEQAAIDLPENTVVPS